ncbi:ribonuclease P protein component [Propionibacteriaceae bacterium Y1685]|uniref:ribonuclease P protein component n=1 Tax=Microlunatus sp. Y1700 TaxID=3418487 RepID=UPI003B75D542
MLPSPQRMRSADEFRATVRGGVRAGQGSVVVHATTSPEAGHRVGFVVSKAVGNAVTRNRVKRRLRHLAAARLVDSPAHTRWVVRALPSSAAAGHALGTDLADAWSRCLRKLER